MSRVELFQYLDDLRASGVTNMYGAGIYLENECGLDQREARIILMDWMKTFDRDVPVEDRAADHK